MKKESVFLGILSMLASVALYPITDATVKFFLSTYSIGQVAFVRSLMRLLCLLVVALFSQESFLSFFKTDKKSLHAQRVLVSLLSTFCFIAACKYGSLTLLYTLGYTTPLFMVCVGALFLREKITFEKLFGVLIGMAGILVAIHPNGEGESLLASSLILLGAFLAAFNKMYIQRLAESEKSVTIALFPNIVMLCLVVPSVSFTWESMPLGDWAIFGALGALMAVSQLLVAFALRCAKASFLAPLDYSAFLWVVAMDALFWSKSVDYWILSGALLILVSNIWICFQGKKQRSIVQEVVQNLEQAKP